LVQWAIVADDPVFHGTGNKCDGEIYAAAPDLDHSNPELRAAIVDWLTWLRDEIGFDGWRFDFVKGYAPIHVKEYVANTVGERSFCVGELWYSCQYGPEGLTYSQDSHRQTLCNWIDATSAMAAVFDFTTKAILQEACAKNELWRLADVKKKPPGLIGWWPNRSVTFLDNHDTGGSQNHWPFPAQHLMMGYAYILTHPGVPSVFWPHFSDSEKMAMEISTLLQARKWAEIMAESPITIKIAESDMYVAEITGAKGSLYVKLGARMDMGKFAPSSNQRLCASGKNYAVWEC